MIPEFPEFVQLTLTSKEIYRRASEETTLDNADLSFSEVFAWRETYKPYISMIEGSICLKILYKDRLILFPPIGKLTFQNSRSQYITYLSGLEHGGYIGGLSKSDAESAGYPYTFDRDNSDYVYRLSDLAELPGKKYHAKRNLIRQFERNYQTEFQPLDCHNVEGCLALTTTWCDMRKCDENPALYPEEHAARELLAHCNILELFGGVITARGQIIAFTVASRLNDSTIVTHTEKANTDYKGIYQAINNYFAKASKGRFEWINRESDIGNEGLRKAKLSYYPAHLVEKYYIKI